MQVLVHKQYDKAWARLSDAQKKRVKRAIQLYIRNANAPQLRLHQLKGHYYPQYSLSVGGDLRIHFLKLDDATIMLLSNVPWCGTPVINGGPS